MPVKTISTIARNVELPLSDDVLKTLHAGDEVLLTGMMYVERDARPINGWLKPCRQESRFPLI